ncbi:hypothetical protein B0F90DRAFT_1377825 [Multifurca ochricompacta]|uniref:Uncharacterized protein n=1 Tax=Multifurca ochricompacta TaxID=376703 RepID=A0AAD4M6K8_9AGAM|nr:hypothetical protein B0F90DRAFT_1377825 [Multifurca ochricompacta]
MSLPISLPITQAPPTTVVASSTSSPSTSSSTGSTSTSTPSTVSTTVTTATTASSSSSSVVSSSSSSGVLSSSSSTTATSTTTSSTTSATSTSVQSTSSSPSASFVIQTSDGQVFTRTSIITVSTSTPTQSPASQSSSSFFHNTGAVAGVFSAVGVLALLLVFVLFTGYIRRRRARKFDREIDEAAAAAASAQPPDFDDYDYTSGRGVGYGPYSETSHGTFSQPPLSHEQPHSLGDVHSPYDPYASVGGVGVAGGAGAAGIGARGRSLRNGGQQDPYGALANPPEQYEMHETGRSWQAGNLHSSAGVANYDLLQAAGLASSDPYAVTRGPSTHSGLSQSQGHSAVSGLTRSQSQGASTLPTSVESYPVPMPAPGYLGGQDVVYSPEKARYSASYAPAGGASTMPPDDEEDPYSGYQDQSSAQLDNPHSPGILGPRDDDEDEELARLPYPHEHEEAARESFADDEDYGYNTGQRVLRVANE